MNIGDTARVCGLTIKSIRYYERIKLVVPQRRQNGYRDYTDDQVEQLKQVRRARNSGFSAEECRSIVEAYRSATPALSPAVSGTRAAEHNKPENSLHTDQPTTNHCEAPVNPTNRLHSPRNLVPPQQGDVMVTENDNPGASLSETPLAKCLQKIDTKERELTNARRALVRLVETARRDPRALLDVDPQDDSTSNALTASVQMNVNAEM